MFRFFFLFFSKYFNIYKNLLSRPYLSLKNKKRRYGGVNEAELSEGDGTLGGDINPK